jgi:hypothetical protein
MAILVGWTHLGRRIEKYIRNFIVVTRVRPGDAGEEDRSDEQVSDEELEVNKFNFAEVIKTRIGGAVAGENEEETGDDSNDGARQAFAKARKMWQIPAQSAALQHPEPGDLEAEKLQKAFVSEAGVHRCEQRVARQKSFLYVDRKCTEQDIGQRLQTNKTRKDNCG